MNYSKRGIKLTTDEFDLKIKESNFTRVTEYVNSNTVIEFKCKRCGKVFKKKPKNFKKLVCNCNVRELNYINSIKDKHISLIEPYTNMKDKLLHRCDKCDNEFRTPPRTVKSSVNGCPVCSGKKFNLKKYKELLPNDIIVIGDYADTSTKTKHKCLTCNNIWETKPNYILHMNTGCPLCTSSKGEKMISNLLNEMGINYNSEYQVNINNSIYRFDFFLPDFNIFIEYDGIQHFKPIEYFGGIDQFEIILNNDKIKNKWISDNKFNLIRIPYTNMDRESILSQLLIKNPL